MYSCVTQQHMHSRCPYAFAVFLLSGFINDLLVKNTITANKKGHLPRNFFLGKCPWSCYIRVSQRLIETSYYRIFAHFDLNFCCTICMTNRLCCTNKPLWLLTFTGPGSSKSGKLPDNTKSPQIASYQSGHGFQPSSILIKHHAGFDNLL